MMMRFADYQREEWKTEQEQKIHRTLRKKMLRPVLGYKGNTNLSYKTSL
jgi:hypothetical protein